jgi:hypothetical protein
LLRKLFISLLILSALTSKGAADLIFDFDNHYPERLNLCGDKSLSGTLAADLPGDITVDGLMRCRGNIIAPLEDILQVHSTNNKYYYSEILFKHTHYDLQAFTCLYIQPVIYDRDVAISGTDISPPVL